MSARAQPRAAAAAVAAITLCLGPVGCLGNVEGFARRGAALYCKRLRECYQSQFDEDYGGDLSRCKDDVENDALTRVDAAEDLGCDYVPEEGRKCVAAARKNRTDCSDDAQDDIIDECAEVFDCPGNTNVNGVSLFYSIGF